MNTKYDIEKLIRWSLNEGHTTLYACLQQYLAKNVPLEDAMVEAAIILSRENKVLKDLVISNVEKKPARSLYWRDEFYDTGGR